MTVAALRQESAPVSYDEPVDLGVYDEVFDREVA